MILISGSSGFIGKELIQLFKKKKLISKRLEPKTLKKKKKFFLKI